MPAQKTCRDCRLFIHDPQALEAALPGLNILSSAYGSVRGETGLCKAYEKLVTPGQGCAAFSQAADPTA